MEICPFYSRIGACRHGETCTRQHDRPDYIGNLPQNTTTDEEEQSYFDDFFEEVFKECFEKYGEIDEMNVCGNLGKHLYGNVFIKFQRSKYAQKAYLDLNNRWFGGRAMNVELSPVLDFYGACCPQFDRGECQRGDFCNFMHLKPISKTLEKRIEHYLSEYERQIKREYKRSKHHKHSSPSSSRSSRSSSNFSTSASSDNSHSNDSRKIRGSKKRSHKHRSHSGSRSAPTRRTPDYGHKIETIDIEKEDDIDNKNGDKDNMQDFIESQLDKIPNKSLVAKKGMPTSPPKPKKIKRDNENKNKDLSQQTSLVAAYFQQTDSDCE